MKRYIFLLLVLSLALVSCGAKCNLEDYTTVVEPLVAEWDDTIDIANQTPRMSLANVISDLQDIKRQTDNAEIPECFEESHSFLIKSMDFTIEGFLAFMGQEDDDVVSQKFNLAETNFETYMMRLAQATEE